MRADESHEQQALIAWAHQQVEYPELRRLFAIPNGGLRSARTAARLKAEGVVAGVPDLFLPVMRGGFGGLFIEMKAVERAKQWLKSCSEAQREWLWKANDDGYCTVVAFGARAAEDALRRYLAGAYCSEPGGIHLVTNDEARRTA